MLRRVLAAGQVKDVLHAERSADASKLQSRSFLDRAALNFLFAPALSELETLRCNWPSFPPRIGWKISETARWSFELKTPFPKYQNSKVIHCAASMASPFVPGDSEHIHLMLAQSPWSLAEPNRLSLTPAA